MKIKFVHVRMGDDQYGNELMDKLAQKALAEHSEPGAMVIVNVQEHGGWFLDFAMINGKLCTVDSANDQAYKPPEIRAFWALVNCPTNEREFVYARRVAVAC
jgi:hypothetical protein